MKYSVLGTIAIISDIDTDDLNYKVRIFYSLAEAANDSVYVKKYFCQKRERSYRYVTSLITRYGL